jgi:lipopolysaccharide export system protein LptC
MGARAMLITLLIAAVAATGLLLRQRGAVPYVAARGAHEPDYYLEDFTSLNTDAQGTPGNRLSAAYLAHYDEDDTSEIQRPAVELFRDAEPPLFISAETGWVTSQNDVILLHGAVHLQEDAAAGKRPMQVDSRDVRVLVRDRYAETDQRATIRTGRLTVAGTGLRAYLDDGRLLVLNHEKTTIAPRPGS